MISYWKNACNFRFTDTLSRKYEQVLYRAKCILVQSISTGFVDRDLFSIYCSS